jgi:hypothetical protein
LQGKYEVVLLLQQQCCCAIHQAFSSSDANNDYENNMNLLACFLYLILSHELGEKGIILGRAHDDET